jgi:hypothetical protein
MKTSFILLSLLLSMQLHGQGLFPLQKGNLWQYKSDDLQYPDSWEARILGDTTLLNGKTYVIYTGFGLGANFLRQKGAKVFAFSFIDSMEYVLFDFAASPKDTICHHLRGTRTIVLSDKYADTWVFLDLVGNGPGSYDFYDWFIRDSIGLTGLIAEPGEHFYLTGAIVNGKVIGLITDVQTRNLTLPESPILYQNYPNPFNPSTNISFAISERSLVSLRIFDLLGREVKIIVSEVMDPGYHSCQWNASDIPSGVYFCRLQAGSYGESKKLVLLK